jgi:predicted TIM-barrel fold metal-dependent hydrolase
MENAGVSRAVLVPVDGRIDECLAWSKEEPEKYGVVAPLRNATLPPERIGATISDLRAKGCFGVRVSTFLPEDVTAFDRGEMESIWRAAEDQAVPIMVLPATRLSEMSRVAEAHPDLKLCIDHMGIVPRLTYDSFTELLDHLLPLASYPNVVVKMTQILRSVNEHHPYPTLHHPIKRVVETFGPGRVFWGSDLTVFPNPYFDCVQLFLDVLTTYGDDVLELVMGKAVCEWLGWDV